MTELFLSHSSSNNAEALALRDWLVSEGWTDLFLDLDPERGIVAGERWERALHQAASRCDAVLFLVSGHWLRSEWCRRELSLARRLNKRIFVLLVEDLQLGQLPLELTESWQLVSLASGSDHGMAREVTLPGAASPSYVYFSESGLQRLKNGLQKAGLDPQSFPWPPASDPDRSPYRGLRPLEAEDAGIFFGREASVIELLAQLRAMKLASPPRLLAILGASGAGKSSFLRAGILPRLSRDDRHYMPLPVIRPGTAVLTGPNGMLACMRKACRIKGLSLTRKQLADAIERGSETLRPILLELATRAAVPDWNGGEALAPTLVLSVDQGEELFQAEGHEEARRFLGLLGELLTADAPSLLAVFTIRSDSYDALQCTAELQGISQKTFSLPPMPKGAYVQVIEAPARLLAKSRRPLKVDPKLTEALLQDVERGGSKDSLPLLAFTLERLFADYGDGSDLRLAEYECLGRIEGAIETAVEQALRQAQQDPKIPRDREECLKLLRRGLIPWMAGIDPQTNLPRRKVAKLAQVPAEAMALIRHFIEHRLLSTDTDEHGEITVEPAHEALLRQWGKLRGWLEEDAAALATLESIKAASRDWEANGNDRKWLAHQRGRLEDAEAIQQQAGLAGSLDVCDRRYLAECRSLEDEVAARELNQVRRLAAAENRVARGVKIGLTISILLLILTTVSAVIAWRQGDRARLLHVKEVAIRLASEAVRLLDRSIPGGDVRAVEKILAAAQLHSSSEVTMIAGEVVHRLGSTHRLVDVGSPIMEIVNSPSGENLVTVDAGGAVRSWNARSLKEFDAIDVRSLAHSVSLSADGEWILVVARSSGTADKTVSAQLKRLREPAATIHTFWKDQELVTARLLPTGGQVVGVLGDGTVQARDAMSGELLWTRYDPDHRATSLSIDPTAQHVATISHSGSIKIWSADDGTHLHTLVSASDGTVITTVFSADGRILAAGTSAGTLAVWDLTSGKLLATRDLQAGSVSAIAFSDDGRRIFWASGGDGDAVAFLTDGGIASRPSSHGQIGGFNWPAMEPLPFRFAGHVGSIAGLVVSKDSRHVVSAGQDGVLRSWAVGAVPNDRAQYEVGNEKLASLAISPDGRRLAAGTIDTGMLQIKPDGRMSFTGQQGSIRIWDLGDEQRQPLWQSSEHGAISMLLASPDSKWLYAGSQSGVLLRVALGSPNQSAQELLKLDSAIEVSAMAEESGVLAVGTESGSFYLWDSNNSSAVGNGIPAGQGGLGALAFLNNGSWLASGGVDGSVKIWDTRRLLELAHLPGIHQAVIIGLVPVAGDSLMAISYGNATASILKINNAGRAQIALALQGTSALLVRSAADGYPLAMATLEGRVIFVDPASGRIVGEVKFEPGQMPLALAQGRDGRLLAIGDVSGAIRVRNGPSAWPDVLCEKLVRSPIASEWDLWISPDVPRRPLCVGHEESAEPVVWLK